MSDASSKEIGGEFPARGPRVSWGPVASIVVAMLTLFGSQILAYIILAAGVVIFSNEDTWLGSTAAQFCLVLLSDIFIVLAIWLFLRRRKAKLKDVGYSRKPAWKDLGYALLAWLVYFGVFFLLVVVAQAFTQIDVDQKQELGFEQLLGTSDKLLALISLVVLPPIIEEFIFRGFMFTGLRTKLRFVPAAIITSVAFASLHLLASSEGLLWIAGLDTIILSLVLCYLREKTGALWAPMALHAVKNAIAFSILLTGVAVI